MYAVSVSRSVIAQHALTVPDPGPEGELHSHNFTIEATLRGSELDAHEYLVDIDDLVAAMDRTAAFYSDRVLNDLPAFEGANPSVERFARVFGDRLLESLSLPDPVTELRVEIQEDDVARVAHERTL
ncbi:PtpS family protein [Natrialba magadii ATCC 43099]|uniref:6-pyruvoyl-tetrahydropterin synthase n=1 Tax=Natrialba magadii (strain ATCC 43099 / DSM 3394 / CCM 3739 / CIP 104546 / IAM 13178 / JCM 8861 / NBRC 102185 / NCIMB 2190 / MS3) TaxID=547559 RepID=D3STX4_NATMM|nr:6-carboxytetrahydropterin synthase [Natrialba magadii]ADD07063.1 PtpS family protein [Natrialba magadii ATCC 43099]ELY28794.1 6-pyruvoyl-tetrahydropterin synthase [Natrialba magadii ATCC 43099]